MVKRGAPCGSDAVEQISDASDADEKIINTRVFCVLFYRREIFCGQDCEICYFS